MTTRDARLRMVTPADRWEGTFYGWLLRHLKRSTPFGDLARDAERSRDYENWRLPFNERFLVGERGYGGIDGQRVMFPRRVSSLDELFEYLNGVGASDKCLRVAKRAWRRYECSVQKEPGSPAGDSHAKASSGGSQKPPCQR